MRVAELREGKTVAIHRPSQQVAQGPRRLAYIPILLSVVVAAAVAIVLLMNDADEEPTLDNDLCPTEDARISASVALLLDLRKPLDQQGRALLGDALRTVTQSMGKHAELRTFLLADNAGVARRPLDRLCKPYANAELAVADSDTAALSRDSNDCDSVPAQLAAPVRDQANRFCARRDALQQRIDSLIAPPQPVANAFLVEALEETSLAFADATPASRPRSLYVFSDMAQHATWYSHWELGSSGWRFDEFQRLRDSQTDIAGPPPPALHGVAATIFYVPRQGVTDQPATRQTHQDFWRRYLAGAFGSAPVFRDQPVMPMYELAPLPNGPTEAELAERERLQVQQQRQEAERLLAEINEELAVLEQQRRNVDEERRRVARAAELRRQQAQAEAQAAEAAQAVAQQGRNNVDLIGLDAAAEVADAIAPSPIDAPISAIGDALGTAVASRSTDAADAIGETRSSPAEAAGASLQPPDGGGASFAARPAGPLAPPTPKVDQAPPTPVAAQSINDPGDVDLPPCEIHLRRRYRELLPTYPSIRAQYSTARIFVRYVVDEMGRTVDDEVTMLAEESTASQPQFLDEFGKSAVDLVRLWRYDFPAGETDPPSCTRRQERTTQIDFRYR